MNRTERTSKIARLKEAGYKNIKGYPRYYIDTQGKVFDIKKGKPVNIYRDKYYQLTDPKGQTRLLNVAKLVLQTLAGIPYNENKRVRFIDGNRANLHPDNLRYAQIHYSKAETNPEDTLTAIRCYFNVPEKFSLKDKFKTKLYLSLIVENRRFIESNNQVEFIEIFNEWLKSTNSSIYAISKRNVITSRDCNFIIKNFVNQLINEILSLRDTGVLEIKPYLKRKTKREEMQELYDSYVHFIQSTGIDMSDAEKMEVRKKVFATPKQKNRNLVKDFENHLNSLAKT